MTPTAAVRSILGDSSGTLSEARCREVVVAVLAYARDYPGAKVKAVGARNLAGHIHAAHDIAHDTYCQMIDALIEEVTAEGGR